MYDIEDICGKYYNNVYRYLMKLSHNPIIAEDLTQETFCIAIKEIDKFKGNCEIVTWLCIIAKHLYYKESGKKVFEDIDIVKNISETSIEDVYIFNEEKLQLYKNLQYLKDNEKNVMYLRLLGLSFKEISFVTGKNETWARVVFHRAKKDLEKYLKGDLENEKH